MFSTNFIFAVGSLEVTPPPEPMSIFFSTSFYYTPTETGDEPLSTDFYYNPNIE